MNLDLLIRPLLKGISRDPGRERGGGVDVRIREIKEMCIFRVALWSVGRHTLVYSSVTDS